LAVFPAVSWGDSRGEASGEAREEQPLLAGAVCAVPARSSSAAAVQAAAESGVRGIAEARDGADGAAVVVVVAEVGAGGVVVAEAADKTAETRVRSRLPYFCGPSPRPGGDAH